MEENIKLEENNLEETKLEEKKEETKKGNKKFKKSAIAIALAAIIAVCGSLVKTSPHEIEGSLTDFVNNNKETTLFDDILDLDEEVGVKNTETGDIKKIQLEDAIIELEEKISVDEKIDNLKIKKGVYNELSDEAKKSTIEFFNENGIDTMIELYNDKNNNKIEKARIAQQLLYVQEYNSEWLKENGVKLSESILSRVISAGVIDSYGTFTPEEYKICSIGYHPEDKGVLRKVILEDPISGERDSVVFLPVFAEEYYKAYGELQLIASKKDFSEEEVTDIVKDTLNISKRCINKQLDLGAITLTKKNKVKKEKN